MTETRWIGVWTGPWVEVRDQEGVVALHSKGCYGVKSTTKDCSILSLQEAFYLHHCLSCLDIIDTKGSQLSSSECWQLFAEQIGKRFVPLLVAYIHLRSFGWVVRCGVTMGTDFLIYRAKGPDFYHSEFGVYVHTPSMSPVVEDTSGDPSFQEQWLSLQTALRLMKSVEKKVLMCFVFPPEPMESAVGETQDDQTYSFLRSSSTLQSGSDITLENFAECTVKLSQARGWLPTN